MYLFPLYTFTNNRPQFDRHGVHSFPSAMMPNRLNTWGISRRGACTWRREGGRSNQLSAPFQAADSSATSATRQKLSVVFVSHHMTQNAESSARGLARFQHQQQI